MERPSKKDIKAAIDKLKEKKSGGSTPSHQAPKLEAKKESKRIRKQGI